MPVYEAFGLLIESDAPLFEPVAAEPESADCRLCLATDRISALESADWKAREHFSDGSFWLSSAKLGASYALRFSGKADFLISPDRRQVSWVSRGASVDTIRHLFLDQVLPRLLASRDHAVLHASAVMVGNEAIAFMGDSGQGKSTLSASLAACGYPLITDDSLLLQKSDESVNCVPSYPGVRLWEESVGALFDGSAVAVPIAHQVDKYRLNARENKFAFASKPIALRKIFLLSPDLPIDEESSALSVQPEPLMDVAASADVITITPISPSEVFGDLLAASYRLEFDDALSIREEFELLSWIAGAVRFARLSYPHDFSLLPQIQRAILEDIA